MQEKVVNAADAFSNFNFATMSKPEAVDEISEKVEVLITYLKQKK